MFIIEDPTVTVKCSTAIQALFLYLNLCLSVKLDSHVHLHPYPFLLIGYETSLTMLLVVPRF
jgi:hypothetical protein